MPRKRIDHRHEASMARITAAMQDPRLIDRICDLLSAAAVRGERNIFDSKYQELDETRGWLIQYGLFYSLRDLCDAHDLYWSHDWPYVMRLVIAIQTAQKQPSDYEKTVMPPDCPPELHWQWWRMAQIGLGLTRENELQAIAQPRPSGLTLKDIAEKIAITNTKEKITDRTVMRAIDRCWQYATRSDISINFRQIANLAGLDDGEGWRVFMCIELYYERRKTQRAKHTRERPDK